MLTRPPSLARAIIRVLLPDHEIRDALEGDLDHGFRSRARKSPARARLWYWGQVLRIPYLSLNRQIRRLERGRRPKETMKGGGWMGGMAMDFRVALRALVRRPAFAAVSVTTLALSIGAATLTFSVVEGVLLAPLPYPEPDELVTIYLTNEEWRDGPNELLRDSWDKHNVTLRHVEAWRGADVSLSSVGGYTYRRTPLDPGDGSDETATAIMVDRGVFSTLDVSPELGRLPSEDEIRQGDPVAVLRYQTWTSDFGGDPDILGRSFRLGPDVYTVIGVMPPGFFFPRETESDLWIPAPQEVREWPTYYGLGRLAEGAERTGASAALDRVARRLGEEDAELSHLGARAVPHMERVVGSIQGGIYLLFGTALLVVLVACVNLGNLVLARTSGRMEELAVRAALGAGRSSLVATVLTEILIVGVVGGGLGLGLAALVLDPFVASLDASVQGLPRAGTVSLNPVVYLFSVLTTLATALAAGLVPALSAGRRAPARATSGSSRAGTSRGTRRGQRALLAVQAAFTVVLLAAAGLLARSFLEATRIDTGLDVERVGYMHVTGSRERYPGPDELAVLKNQLQERLRAIPGVASATLTSSLPSMGGVGLLPVRAVESQPDEASLTMVVTVGQDYFKTVGVSILAGRSLSASDARKESRGVVVSESLARQLFGSGDALGRQMVVQYSTEPRTLEVVGIVEDARQLSVLQAPQPTFYMSIEAGSAPSFAVAFRSDGNPEALLRTASEAILEVDPTLKLGTPGVLADALRASLRSTRLRMTLMVSLAVLAGVLALIGIASVVTHYLSEQTREVGIRMALGAHGAREIRRVVRHAISPTVTGLVVGILAAVASSRIMESFLFQIEPTDPLTYAAVTGLLLVMAALAAWIPARRAARVDPAEVLNRE